MKSKIEAQKDNLDWDKFPYLVEYEHDGDHEYFHFVVFATGQDEGTVVWVDPKNSRDRFLGEYLSSWSFYSPSMRSDRWKKYTGKVILENDK